MRFLILPLLAALAGAGLADGAAPLTIKELMSAPFPSDLAAAPRGDAFAWVVNAEGVRNIWMARAPGFVPVKITSFAEDDGQSISDLSWVPDDSAVYFTRGGSANGKGEFPNPLSNAEGVKQEIWVAVVSGAARKIADGHTPAVSPDGRRVCWIQGGQIWFTQTVGAFPPVQLTHARGSASEVVWSPDGTRVAFTSDRSDHSFIGVGDFRDKSLAFVDAGADLDQSPAWSPDGSEIAFVRVPGSRYAFAWGPKRTGQPWSIRVTDAKSGKGREIWKAREGMGSVFWPMTAVNQLLWSSRGYIVFPWEGDGWLHLYSIFAKGGQAESLAPGNYEVENATLSIDGNDVVYSSNQMDIDRRHLWTIPASRGSQLARRLTMGSGVEARPVALAGNRVGYVRSDAKLAPRIALLENGASRDLAAPPDFPSDALVTPQPVEFTAADGIRIHAQLFLPSGTTQKRHPAVVFFHGGSRRQMVLGWQYMSYYSRAYAFNQYLASKGYVVLSVNYRSGTGYGERFREALRYGATGGSEFADVLAAGNFLKARADVDGARIGLWGGSYGGYLTALGLAKASNLFAVGVDLHGVHDWNLEITNYVPMYEPEKRQEISTTAFRSSPMAYVETWKSPVLLIHGDDDRNVPFSETVLLEEKLRKQGVHFEELIFPDEVHEFLVHAHWLAAYAAADEFFARYLKP